jgi:hypothetical protein
LIPDNNAAPMKLNTGALVCFKIIYANELLSMA